MKSIIYIGSVVGSLIGGALGAKLDNGNIMGLWSLLLAGIGAIAGIWLGYIVSKNYF